MPLATCNTRQMLTASWGEPECFFEVLMTMNTTYGVAYKRFISTYMIQIGMHELTSVKQ